MEDRSRRKMLKLLGTATGAGVLGASTVQARSGDASTFDTGFDPDDERAVAEFVGETFRWSEDVHERVTAEEAEQQIATERRRVVQDLTDRQLTAVERLLRDLELKVERTEPEVNRVDADSCNEYKDNVKGFISVPFVGNTLLAFNFVQEVGWCVDGDEVINVTPSTIGNAKGYVLVNWDYNGTSESNLSYHPDNYYAVSYQKGAYDRCLVTKSGISCVATDYGYIEAAVYNDRSGRTVDKGANG